VKEHIYINDEVLVKYLLQEASSAEAAAIAEWIEETPENARYFEQFRLLWDRSKELAPRLDADPETAWQRLQLRLQQQPETKAALPRRRIALSFARIAAALVVLLAGAGIYYMLADRSISLEATTAAASYTLPDGSMVTLNRHATLSYQSKNFGQKERHVRLDGEAFFQISPNKEKPFIIDADDASIRVVGTSFNVKTSPDKTEVIVETGIVRLSKQQASTELRAHEKGLVLKNSVSPIREQSVDSLHNYYRTKTFICRNTPLSRLTEVLSEAYEVKIVPANKSIGGLPLTATFRQDSLEHILDVVCATLNLRAERNGAYIILK
jgi:ferric-dicitrate binding protein FerR (iron transport regulator)